MVSSQIIDHVLYNGLKVEVLDQCQLKQHSGEGRSAKKPPLVQTGCGAGLLFDCCCH